MRCRRRERGRAARARARGGGFPAGWRHAHLSPRGAGGRGDCRVRAAANHGGPGGGGEGVGHPQLLTAARHVSASA